SAHDRARTIEVAIDPDMGAADVVTPGHVFPLVAREGGTLVRAGHTEAVVDIARLAGFNPSGVICEIMKDDGTMARLPDLITFAQYHGLKVASIADLIGYRRRTESIVKRAVESDLASRFGGDWRMIVYVNKATYAEHVALVKGNITGGEPVLVRMHAINVLDDVLGETSSGGAAGNVQAAMNEISAAGCGVLVLIREPTPTALSDMVRRRLGQAGGDGDCDDDPGNELRDYGVGAQILLDLGVREMTLLTNSTRNVVGLDGYGLRVVERRAFGSPPQGEGT
ncbi:MAG: 3,4-dihydroxy-2-butanone-4-phosphate synthase, partial [Pseudomonadota bacterium]|nr:3,4-dihydroxy-2-butanone-4-phosphate synthase [Pseudomonadota bacterium]